MMNKKRVIAVVTGTRAEYGLLHLLLHEITSDTDVQLQLIVTGMHLSREFGLTYCEIEQDGFVIDAKVDMLLSSDSAVGIAKSTGLGVIGFADCFERLQPDCIVVLGDRFEILAAAQAAMIMKIPVAHIHGGELTRGAIDDGIRHAITKMSHLHFTAADAYRQRVIQLGESPQTVFNVGSLGVERIYKTTFLSQSQLEKILHFQFGKPTFLITYHPATLLLDKIAEELKEFFCALDLFPYAKMIITKTNADEAGRFINHEIDGYIAKNSERAAAFVTMGDLNYLNAMKYCDVVIGNSSSGIIEVPTLHKPTVNIGDRQTGRLRASSIIDCGVSRADIYSAIQKALSSSFLETARHTLSPYDAGNTAMMIKDILKTAQLKQLLHKTFYDMRESVNV